MKKNTKEKEQFRANDIILILTIMSVYIAVMVPIFLNQAKIHREEELKLLSYSTYLAGQLYANENGMDDMDVVYVNENGNFEKRYAISHYDIKDYYGEEEVDFNHYDKEKDYLTGDILVRTRFDEQGRIAQHRFFTHNGNYTARLMPEKEPEYKEGNQIKNLW